jgi:hypothetical protein
VFTYRAAAEDNRHDHQGQVAPNKELTIEYQFTIVEPIEARKNSQPSEDEQSMPGDEANESEPNGNQPNEPPPNESEPQNGDSSSDPQSGEP